MVKPGGLAGTHRGVHRVLVEEIERASHVVEQQLAQVAADTVPHEDSLDNQILTIRGQ
jgi:hypothetical protein